MPAGPTPSKHAASGTSSQGRQEHLCRMITCRWMNLRSCSRPRQARLPATGEEQFVFHSWRKRHLPKSLRSNREKSPTRPGTREVPGMLGAIFSFVPKILKVTRALCNKSNDEQTVDGFPAPGELMCTAGCHSFPTFLYLPINTKIQPGEWPSLPIT